MSEQLDRFVKTQLLVGWICLQQAFIAAASLTGHPSFAFGFVAALLGALHAIGLPDYLRTKGRP